MTRVFGVHSEVGKLKTVMLCPPGRAHERLTPGNCRDLLFDDVLWVQEAREVHFDFVLKMRDRGIEVLDFSVFLGATMEGPAARNFVLSHCVTRNSVGPVIAEALYPWLESIPGPHLAELLIGGIAIEDVPWSESSDLFGEAMGEGAFLIPPIPNTLFQRDPSCWIYGGVTCNPMFWPARKPETLLQRAVYKFHPFFKNGDFKIWFGASDEDFWATSLEGGDSELLARELEADLFIMATDADAVFADWGKPTARAIRRATPAAMRDFNFPAGSMGPKVDAASQFAQKTGTNAAIGALKDLPGLVRGTAGTTITTSAAGVEWPL
jgi:arginine deiminase